MKKLEFLISSVFIFLSTSLFSQPIWSEGDTTVCPWQDTSYYMFTEPPAAFLEGAELGLEFDVTFLDSVPSNARAGILQALNIWGALLSSEVPVTVEVNWLELEGNTLASAGPRGLYRGFREAAPDSWYPVALAEALLGQELNESTEADIVITVNSDVNWYFGLDGNTPGNQFDLVTVILHEVGHGLGFFSSSAIDEDMTLAEFGFGGFPMIYDRFLTDEINQPLLDTLTFPNRSVQLLSALTSNEVVFNSPNAATANNGQFPPIYAPSSYEEGSSISHLDERAYRPGTINSLMTPGLGRAEAIHDPGPVTLAIFEDIGWALNFTTNTNDRPQALLLEVFPNPATGFVQLTLPEAGRFTLRLFDAQGKLVRPAERWEQLENVPQRVDLNQLAEGNYFMLIEGEGKRYVSKIVLR